MRALDTNVLVRYLAQDDARQSAAAVHPVLQRDRAGKVDLHDCLIVSLAEQRKARVVTFDAKTAWRLGMELPR